MSKKLLTLLSVVAVILVGITVFNYEKPGASRTNPGTGQKQEKITIAQAGDFYLYAPLYIAADQGFFAKNGVDVTIVSTGGDEKTWAAVISRSAQFGVADPTFIAIASQRGQPGKIISTIVNGVPFWGITKNDKIPLIDKPESLGTYKVATFPSPSTAYTLQRRMYEMGGLKPNIREGAFGTLNALVEAGEADIALELEPNVSQAVANGYRVIYSLSEVYGDFTITGLTATPEYIKANAPTVAAVVRAIGEAMKFLHENPAEATKLLAKRFPEIKEDVAKAALDRVLSSGILPKSPTVVEAAWSKAIQLRIDAGDVKPTKDIMEFVDNSFSKH